MCLKDKDLPPNSATRATSHRGEISARCLIAPSNTLMVLYFQLSSFLSFLSMSVELQIFSVRETQSCEVTWGDSLMSGHHRPHPSYPRHQPPPQYPPHHHPPPQRMPDLATPPRPSPQGPHLTPSPIPVNMSSRSPSGGHPEPRSVLIQMCCMCIANIWIVQVSFIIGTFFSCIWYTDWLIKFWSPSIYREHSLYVSISLRARKVQVVMSLLFKIRKTVYNSSYSGR